MGHAIANPSQYKFYMNWSGQVKKFNAPLQSSGKGNALVKESFYARKAFFIDSGVGTSLVSEGEEEERDKADLDLSSEVPSM
jgi:hypothetical protein